MARAVTAAAHPAIDATLAKRSEGCLFNTDHLDRRPRVRLSTVTGDDLDALV